MPAFFSQWNLPARAPSQNSNFPHVNQATLCAQHVLNCTTFGYLLPSLRYFILLFTLGTRGSREVGADWVLVSWAGDSCGRSTCYSTSSSFCFFLQLAQSMYMLIPYYIIICSFLVLLLLFKVWEGYRLLSNFYFAAKPLVADVRDPSNREDGHQRIVNPITRTIKTKKRKREHKI